METTLTRSHLHEQLLELKMKHAERTVDRLCDEAASRQSGYTEFLSLVLDAELVQRRDRGTQMRLKLAHFPLHKTLEQFGTFGRLKQLIQDGVDCIHVRQRYGAPQCLNQLRRGS